MEKRKLSPVSVLFAILIIYFACETLITTYYYFSAKKTLRQTETKIAETKEETEKLKQEINNLNSQYYIEKYARENLMLAKENETIIYFKQEEEEKQASSEEQPQSSGIKKLFQNLLKLFEK